MCQGSNSRNALGECSLEKHVQRDAANYTEDELLNFDSVAEEVKKKHGLSHNQVTSVGMICAGN